MKRTDRLFEIINILRSAKEPVTADQIAQQLEVTPRTIYRYIASLQAMRVPIEGATGLGYVLRRGYDLPPLNFDEEELEAIIVGLSMLARTGDEHLQRSAGRVLNKIEANHIRSGSLQVSHWGIESAADPRLQELRTAIRNEQMVEITYQRPEVDETRRTVWPLILTYFTEVAVLSAWCTLRQDFRNFRVDRIRQWTVREDRFDGRGGKLRQELSTQLANLHLTTSTPSVPIHET